MSSEQQLAATDSQPVFVTSNPNEDDPNETLKQHEVYYQQLDEVIGQIDEHFKRKLVQHQKDFIKAYEGQMLKVQKELSFLKNKQAEQAGKLMKDDDITNLQSSIAWFKSEAVKLN
jgi:hypothetical protein